MQHAHIFNLLNDIVLLSAEMQQENPHDLARLAEARRLGADARAILRLLLAEPSPRPRSLHII